MPTRRLKLGVVLSALALAVLAGAAQRERSPILVLVSFDGWRWDYTTRASAPNLRALASHGVRARGLIPSFPTNTFPNHYTIVTGLYPEHHGIVSNDIVDPSFPERFTRTAETAKNARWWGGEPLWVTAIRQGQRADAMFWPGSEAAIAGMRPTDWKPFDDKMPNADRVKQVLDWLALPPDRQPSLVTLYFSEVDHAGHDYGPDSVQVLDAAQHLDEALGQLVSGIQTLQLLDRTSIVVVSDHGMSQHRDSHTIFLDDYLDLSTVDVIEWMPLELAPRSNSSNSSTSSGSPASSGSVDEIYRALKGKHRSLAIYKREEVPARLHYRDNPRIAPVIGLVDDGWIMTSHQRIADARKEGRPMGGDHGYDPKYRSMHGVFVAAGPRIARGRLVPEFQNVHIYSFLCEILGLRPARNDGDPNVTRKFFAD